LAGYSEKVKSSECCLNSEKKEMALDGTPFLVQAVYSFKGKNNDEVIIYICYL
jgi:hypothetical protein